MQSKPILILYGCWQLAQLKPFCCSYNKTGQEEYLNFLLTFTLVALFTSSINFSVMQLQ